MDARVSSRKLIPAVLALAGVLGVTAHAAAQSRQADARTGTSARVVLAPIPASILRGEELVVAATSPRDGSASLERSVRKGWARLTSRRVAAGRPFLLRASQPTAGRARLRVVVKSHGRTVAVSRAASIIVRANGRRAVPRAGTIEVPASAVVLAPPDPQAATQQVTLAAGTRLPRVGGGIVINASGDFSGLVGSVVAIDRNPDGTTTLTTRSVELSTLYREYKVAYSGLVPGSDSAPSQSLGAHAFTEDALPLRCSGVPGSPVSLETDFTRNARFDFFFDARVPAIHFLFVSRPLSKLTVNATAGATCELSLPRRGLLIPGTPVVLDVGPKISFTLTSGVNMELTYESRLALGFDHGPGVHQPIYANGTVSSSASATAGATATATLFVGASMEMKVAGIAGVGGDAGIEVVGEARVTPTSSCLSVDSALVLGLYAKLDFLIRDWTWDLAKGRFLRTDLYGPVCKAPPVVTTTPGGGGSAPPAGGGGSTPPASGGGTPPSTAAPRLSITGVCTTSTGTLHGVSSGFTPGGVATIRAWYPDGRAYTNLIATSRVSSAGAISWTWPCAGDPAGTYTTEAIDQTSGRSTGRVPFTIAAVVTPPPVTTWSETTGGATNTWTNYANAGGTQGATIPGGTTVQIACKLTGFRVADGNTWWYRIASSPWNSVFYASADAFYNNGQTSGSLIGTPFVDGNVRDC